MGRTKEGNYESEVLAIITLNKDRIMGGKQLTLLAENEEQQNQMAQELAVTLKADMAKLKFGDYLIIRS